MNTLKFSSPFPAAAETPPPEESAHGGNHAPSMEVAHVLFMDIIGYSKLRMNQQAAAQIELQTLVNSSAEVQQAKAERKFICRPTGDGMALLFFRDLVSPVRAALQIHALMDQRAVAMRAAIGADIKMRMGIHSGTILMVEDLNAQSDAAGDGINIAQRVMDCGDADHILLSSRVAESLLNADPWQNYLTDLGEVRVKHGVKVHLYRLRGRLDGGYYGNPGMPKKVALDQKSRQEDINKYRGSFWERHPGAKKKIAAFVVLAAIIGVPTWQWLRNPHFQEWGKTQYTKATTFTRPKPVAKVGGKNSGGASHTARNASGGGGRRNSSSSGGGYDSGPHKSPVPDLVGRSLEDAVSTGSDAGMRVAKSDKSSWNGQYGEGIIYEQSPSAGTMAKDGTRVYVRISKGDAPDAAAADAAAATAKEPDATDATNE